MRVIKRNGSEVDFDKNKIKIAISKANKEAEKNNEINFTDDEIDNLTNEISDTLQLMRNTPTVEDIQDIVEKFLLTDKGYNVARRYIRYRYEREIARQGTSIDDEIMSLINNTNEVIKQENSNKAPTLIPTQRDYMAGIISKSIALRKLYSKDVVEAHKSHIIHIHDLDYMAQTGMYNCCLINLEDMLQNGTVISKTMIEKPHRFLTACTITSQIVAQVSSCQFGGQSINLAHLAPFVNESRKRIRKSVIDNLALADIDCTEKQVERIVDERLKKEIADGLQTLQYQLVTLMTTNGQSPFITVFMYLNDESIKDNQTKKDLALIIEEMLNQRIKGVKNEKGIYVTVAFPKLIYVLDKENCKEGTHYWYLTELSAKCSAKRFVPDYISEKIMKQEKDGQVFSSMGCVDGKSVVTYKIGNTSYTTNFETMWNRLAKHNKVLLQPNGKDEYIKTSNVKIYDHKRGFVENICIIRNTSSKWLRVNFNYCNERLCLECTPDHPFETENRGVVLAKDLTPDDYISINNRGCYHPKVSPIGIGTKYSYDVTTESEHFTVNGIYSHNCRSFLSSNYKDENGKHKFWGRFNKGVVTINLPDVALSSKKNIDKFWKILDERLELCHKVLVERYNMMKGTKSDVAPILWQYGAIARLEKGETIDNLLVGGYSTSSLGYAGLYECVKYMTGKSHTDISAKPFALQIMKYMNHKCDIWNKELNLGFSLYGSPMETTVYDFAKAIRKRFGIIDGITDKNYITNSYHVPVTEKINIFDKLKFEAEFQSLSTGGAISYGEIPNMTHNIPAVLEIIKYIYDNIMYAELNVKSDYCHVCGFDGEIKIVEDEHNKLIWECPNCGNRNQDKMQVSRRTCGYIGTNFWNQGRTQEIKERVVHVDVDEESE